MIIYKHKPLRNQFLKILDKLIIYLFSNCKARVLIVLLLRTLPSRVSMTRTGNITNILIIGKQFLMIKY